MISLAGKRVLVTGGSRGIGAATCRAFARAGAAVAVHYHRRRDAALAVLADLPPALAPHLVLAADLRQREEVRDLFAEVERAWDGTLDALINNAGVWVRNPIAELDDERLDDTWRANVTSVFWCVHEAVPLLGRSADGNIVNVTSTAGQRGEAFYSPYAASKGALISATKAWSSELAPAIRVNSVAPGWVDTDMSAAALHGPERRSIEASIPLRRVATAEDIAGPILFLASPMARHMTGEILNVNGGSVLVG